MKVKGIGYALRRIQRQWAASIAKPAAPSWELRQHLSGAARASRDRRTQDTFPVHGRRHSPAR